jgi:hypothetical protein
VEPHSDHQALAKTDAALRSFRAGNLPAGLGHLEDACNDPLLPEADRERMRVKLAGLAEAVRDGNWTRKGLTFAGEPDIPVVYPSGRPGGLPLGDQQYSVSASWDMAVSAAMATMRGRDPD